MAGRGMAADLSKEEPPSPDPPFWGSNYTPSQESQDVQDFIGRRRLRILNGQDPEKMPDKFTPLVNLLKFEWPKNENARQWASSKPWDDETTWSRNCKPNKRQKKLNQSDPVSSKKWPSSISFWQNETLVSMEFVKSKSLN